MKKPFRPLSRAEQNVRALLVGGALLALVGGGVAVALVNQDPPTDGRACLVGRAPPAVTEVVIDATSRLTKAQAAQVLAVVRAARDRVPRFGEIVLLLVDAEHPYEPQARLDVCNPGAPGQLSVLFHTPSRAQRRWRDAFEKPLDDIAVALTQSKESSTSPLIETITGLTWRSEFRPATGDAGGPAPVREVVLASDLRQYTPSQRISFYEAGAPWMSFARSATATAADANLRGVTVRLEVIHRPEAALPERRVIDFWSVWLAKRGAARVFVDGVPAAPVKLAVAANVAPPVGG